MDTDVPTLFEPLDQVLEALGRHPLARLGGFGVAVVEKVGRLVLLPTRLFGHLAVHLAAVLADIEDLWSKIGESAGCSVLASCLAGRTLTCMDGKRDGTERVSRAAKQRGILAYEPDTRATAEGANAKVSLGRLRETFPRESAPGDNAGACY